MSLLLDLFLTFMKIGAFTFGGGYAMISLLDHECVERKKWITSEELMDVTVIAESTPGPIAINCATFTGYKQAGIAGAVVATVGMVLPSFLIILVISNFMADLLTYPVVAKAFRGIWFAVALLIIQAGIKMIRKMLKKTPNRKLSMLFAVFFFALVLALDILQIHVSTIYLIIISGLLGYCIYYLPKRKEACK